MEIPSSFSGLTAETYRAVIAVVDDRMQNIAVTRKDFDRVVRGQKLLDKRTTTVESRMDRVEDALVKLAEAQARTEAMVQNLLKIIEAHENHFIQIREDLHLLKNLTSQMRGEILEDRYQQRAGSFWGKVLRRVIAYWPADLEEKLEIHLTEAEYNDFLNLDLVIQGHLKNAKENGEVWLALEISSTIDRRDVERAVLRAGYLRKAGYRTLPAVAGEKITQGSETVAEAQQAVINLNGQLTHWEEPLARSLS